MVCSRDETGWKEKHLKILAANYKRAKCFHEVYTDFSALININYPNIDVMNSAIIDFFAVSWE